MVDQRREVRPDGRKVSAVGQPWKRGGRKEQETLPPNVSSSPWRPQFMATKGGAKMWMLDASHWT